RIDVRLVSATNRDLAAAVAAGELRQDLYYRIRGVEVRLPPLRERGADLELLAEHFLAQAAALAPDGRARLLGPTAREAVLAHDWPGNLRELRHEMQRATVLAGERAEIEARDLSVGSPPGLAAPGTTTLADRLAAFERREIEAALAACHGNRTHAAQRLGLSRQGLLNKIERYGL
ncbi:MAG: helix-turn-helix domain-containing protein, partial [Acidobacteriota bacterium]